MSQNDCSLCGEQFDSQSELVQHHVEVHGEKPRDDDIRWWQWAIGIPLVILSFLWRLLWGFWRIAIVLGILVAIAFAIFGDPTDKEKTADSPTCPGYHFVRELKAAGQIESFEAVKPEDGWACEYSLDEEDAEVRFKSVGGETQMEDEGSTTSSAYEAVNRKAEAEGFSNR